MPICHGPWPGRRPTHKWAKAKGTKISRHSVSVPQERYCIAVGAKRANRVLQLCQHGCRSGSMPACNVIPVAGLPAAGLSLLQLSRSVFHRGSKKRLQARVDWDGDASVVHVGWPDLGCDPRRVLFLLQYKQPWVPKHGVVDPHCIHVTCTWMSAGQP
jgi:hypothetical protein